MDVEKYLPISYLRSRQVVNQFYTDVAHVSAATIGMIIAISQIFNGLRIFVPDLSWIVQDQNTEEPSLDATNVRTICNRSYFIDDCSTDCTNGSAIYVFITYNLMLTVCIYIIPVAICNNNDLYDKKSGRTSKD